MKHQNAIWWIKRDFRLSDNRPLVEALTQCDSVLPVFVFEPTQMSAAETSSLHINAQITALKALRMSLQRLGANVCVITGDLPGAFIALRKDYPFTAIYSHQETGSNTTYQRDVEVKEWCRDHAIVWNESPQNAVVRAKKIDKLDKKLWNKFMHEEQAPVVTTFPWSEPLDSLCQKPIPEVPTDITADKLQPVTEAAAKRILSSFLSIRGKSYWGSISSPNTAWMHGSRLSPHIAWGTISLRQVFQATQMKQQELNSEGNKQWNNSLNAFSSRLYWHDHFMQKLESYPEIEYEAVDPRYKHIQYENDDEKMHLWLTGKTGFPLIDATMRCLAETGFVNFSMRAMAISFATFGLHLSWKKILYPFARLMADYEPGIHIYQVQMQSCVTKGQALRVYDPIKQMTEKDTMCEFIKKWIPELRVFTPLEILASVSHHEKYGITVEGKLGTYPLPIVHWIENSHAMKEQVMTCRGKRTPKDILQLHLIT